MFEVGMSVGVVWYVVGEGLSLWFGVLSYGSFVEVFDSDWWVEVVALWLAFRRGCWWWLLVGGI